MTEDEARARIAELADVPRETWDGLERFVALLIAENERQNLIAASTQAAIWSRHILDSAQLLAFAPPGEQRWIDLGSGAGFPGLICAALSRHRVTLVESRRKRIAFLETAVALLGIAERVTIAGQRAETLAPAPHDIISARAFAPLDRLLAIGARFADDRTRWLLPKGRGAASELDAVAGTWQGAFRIEPSLTDPDAAIIVADGVRARRAGKAKGKQ